MKTTAIQSPQCAGPGRSCKAPVSYWLKRLAVPLLLIPLTLTNLQAQAPPIAWDKTFGGSQADELRVVKQTSDGGYILGGTSSSGISGEKSEASKGAADYWVVKIGSSGAIEWEKTFGGSQAEHLFALQQTSDGGYILGGHSLSGISGDRSEASNGGFDFWLVKISSSGVKEWDKALGGDQHDELYALQQTPDGGYILGGLSSSDSSGDKSEASRGTHDFWVAKVDNSGNKQWDKTFGGSGSDQAFAIDQTSDGGYIIGGYSTSNISGEKTEDSKGNYDFWVVKMDGNGSLQWDRTLGGNSLERLSALHQTPDGGYILGGHSPSIASGDKSQGSKGQTDYWLVRLSGSGAFQWDRTIGGDNLDELTALEPAADGGYILGGYSQSALSGDKTEASLGSTDYWIVKTDSLGIVEWDKSFGGTFADKLGALQPIADGGFILAGSSTSGVSGDKSEPSRGGNDYWVVKLGQSANGILAISEAGTVYAYPNPFAKHLTVALPEGPAGLRITNALGVTVASFPAVSGSSFRLDTDGWAPGLYLITVSDKDGHTRSVSVLK